MSNPNNPETSTAQPSPKEGDIVYSRLHDENTIVKGEIVRLTGPDALLKTGNATRRIHQSNLFPTDEMIDMSEDLLFGRPAGEEVPISTALQEVIADPVTQEELGIRMGARAIERYMTQPRTDEQLGVTTVEDLLGDVEKIGSNYWKVAEFISGIRTGQYGEGSSNEIHIAIPSPDIETLPANEAAEVREKIADVNRRVLDQLYQDYGVDLDNAQSVELRVPKGIIRKFAAHSKLEDFSFVATSFEPRDDSDAIEHPELRRVQIVVGTPSFPIENGYLPTA